MLLFHVLLYARIPLIYETAPIKNIPKIRCLAFLVVCCLEENRISTNNLKLHPYFRLHLGATLQPPATRIKNCVIIQIGTQVLIRYLRSFSFCQNPLNTRLFGTFANEINLIVSKFNAQNSKSSDSNPRYFLINKSTMTLNPKISVIANRKVSSSVVLQIYLNYCIL